MLTVRTGVCALVLLVAGCGPRGVKEEERVPDETPIAGPAITTYDFDLDQVVAEPYEPRALRRAPWPVIDTAAASPAEARKRLAKAKGAARAAEAEALAQLLWTDAGTPEAAAAREEARKILRELTAGGAGSLVALAMLAAAEQHLGDPAGARKAYDELLARFAGHADGGSWRGRRAFLDLAAGDRAAAAALVGDAGAAPEELYVRGWLRLYAGDPTDAQRLFLEAAVGWPDGGDFDELGRDIYLASALAGIDPAELDALVEGSVRQSPPTRAVKRGRTTVIAETIVLESPELRMLARAEEYTAAGAWPGARRAWEALAAGKSTYLAVRARLALADLAAAVLDLDELAAQARAAREGGLHHVAVTVTQGGGEAEKEEAARLLDDVAEKLVMLASHTLALWADSRDPRLAAVTRALYEELLAIPGRPPDEVDTREALADLDRWLAEPQPPVSVNRSFIRRVVRGRHRDLRACHARQLLREPGLAGTVTVKLRLTPTALEVAGVDPAAGATGLPAVAGCVAEAARQWPAMPVDARTEVHVSYPFELLP